MAKLTKKDNENIAQAVNVFKDYFGFPDVTADDIWDEITEEQACQALQRLYDTTDKTKVEERAQELMRKLGCGEDGEEEAEDVPTYGPSPDVSEFTFEEKFFWGSGIEIESGRVGPVRGGEWAYWKRGRPHRTEEVRVIANHPSGGIIVKDRSQTYHVADEEDLEEIPEEVREARPASAFMGLGDTEEEGILIRVENSGRSNGREARYSVYWLGEFWDEFDDLPDAIDAIDEEQGAWDIDLPIYYEGPFGSSQVR